MFPPQLLLRATATATARGIWLFLFLRSLLPWGVSGACERPGGIAGRPWLLLGSRA